MCTAQEWTNRTPNATNLSIPCFLVLRGSESTAVQEHQFSRPSDRPGESRSLSLSLSLHLSLSLSLSLSLCLSFFQSRYLSLTLSPSLPLSQSERLLPLFLWDTTAGEIQMSRMCMDSIVFFSHLKLHRESIKEGALNVCCNKLQQVAALYKCVAVVTICCDCCNVLQSVTKCCRGSQGVAVSSYI